MLCLNYRFENENIIVIEATPAAQKTFFAKNAILGRKKNFENIIIYERVLGRPDSEKRAAKKLFRTLSKIQKTQEKQGKISPLAAAKKRQSNKIKNFENIIIYERTSRPRAGAKKRKRGTRNGTHNPQTS